MRSRLLHLTPKIILEGVLPRVDLAFAKFAENLFFLPLLGVAVTGIVRNDSLQPFIGELPFTVLLENSETLLLPEWPRGMQWSSQSTGNRPPGESFVGQASRLSS
jgi:hypothetical protein